MEPQMPAAAHSNGGWQGRVTVAKRVKSQKRPQSADAPRLLLISDQLPQHELLVSAAKANASVIVVRYGEWSLKDLQNAVMATANLPRRQYNSVALMDHGQPGCFCLLKQLAGGSVGLKDIQDNAELQDFFRFLAGFVQTPWEPQNWRQDLHARIDLLSCSVAGSDEGLELITYLEDITQVSWAASSSKVGNASEDCDWVMDTKYGLASVHQYYFDEQRLTKWKGECPFFIPLLVAAAAIGVSSAVAPEPTAAVLNFATTPANAVVSAVGHAVVGESKMRIWNGLEIPVLVAFSNTMGLDIEEPTHVKPKGYSRCTTCVAHASSRVWVSVDGKTWHYDDYQAPGDQETKNISALEVLKNEYTQDFIGFSIQSIVESLSRTVAKFAREAVQEIKRLFFAAVQWCKEKGASILHGLFDMLKVLMDESKGKAVFAKDRKKAPIKHHKSSKDGMTVFQGFFDSQDAGKTDPAGSLHNSVHQLRMKVEDVRFCLMDTHASFDEASELLLTPEHMKQDAGTFRDCLRMSRTAMQSVELSGAGPIGTVVNGVKQCVQGGFKGLENSLHTFMDTMDKVDKNAGLPAMRKNAEEYQKKFKQNVPFKFLEEVNFTLAHLEEQSQELTKQYPRRKKGLLDEGVCGPLEESMKVSSGAVDVVSRAIKPVAKLMVENRKVIDNLHAVADQKRKLRNKVKGPLTIIDKVREAFKQIYEKLVQPILDLPIVKNLSDFFSGLMGWLTETILQVTGLDKLVEWIQEDLNPFRLIQKAVDPLMKNVPALDSVINFADVDAAKRALDFEHLKRIKVVNVEELQLSQMLSKPSAASARSRQIQRPTTPGQIRRVQKVASSSALSRLG